jgi:DNA gyrase subunit A
MIPVKEFSEDKYLTMITKLGFVKKTNLSDYDTNRKGGLIAITLREGDELMGVDLTNGDNNIILCTKNGMCIKFKETDVRPMGRGASGVTGIRLGKDDYVIGGSVCEDDVKLLTVTENGFGKKTDINEFKCQNRAGRGVTGYKITEKTGLVAGIAVINEGDDLMVITSDGIIIRMNTDEISTFGRVTQGVKVMRTSDDVHVVSIAKADKEEEQEEDITKTEETSNETSQN